MSEQLPSRVVHLRLRNSTILGCHKLTEIQQGESDTPMSSMVADVLDNLINKLVNAGKLPNVEDMAAGTVLNAIYRTQVDEEGDIDIEEEPDIMADFLEAVEVEDDVISDNLAEHDIPLDKEFQKRSPDEQQVKTEIINYPPIPPWENKSCDDKTFTDIERIAPKDILVEAASCIEQIQRAVEIVYSSLPIDMWGSAKAQELVREVMPIVEHYLGPILKEEETDETT